MLVIGLTGGIGSGKSTAAQIFGELGAEIIDTDAIAHALTAPGQPAVEAIAAAFGPQYIGPDGALNRAAMRRLVFDNAEAKQKLENILHPLIRAAVADRLATPTTAPYRIVVVPLLFETNAYASLIHRALVVDCPEEMQIKRAISRSRLQEEDVRAIIAAQIPRPRRLAAADDVIVNDSTLENLTSQVNEMHKKYLRLA